MAYSCHGTASDRSLPTLVYPRDVAQPVGRLSLHYRSQSVCIGNIDGFFLMRCFGNLSSDDVRACLKAHTSALRHRPQGVGSVTVIDPTATMPSDETRRAINEVTKQTLEHALGSATVVLGDGFWASAMRGVMTTINLVSNPRHPNKVFRHEAEAVEWVIKTLGESLPAYRRPLLDGLAQLQAVAKQPLVE